MKYANENQENYIEFLFSLACIEPYIFNTVQACISPQNNFYEKFQIERAQDPVPKMVNEALD